MQILIYSDEGTSYKSVENIYRFVRDFFPLYNVSLVGARDLALSSWEADCSLLIVPGGRDVPYEEAWTGFALHERVRKYVSDGGNFLGICAGAYFSCTSIEFYKGNKLYEIIQDRKLGFFEGIAKGPITESYSYIGDETAEALSCFDQKLGLLNFRFYYNGGCIFISDPNKNTYEKILFMEDRETALIVGGKFGDGYHILSGVHPEYNDSTNSCVNELLQKNIEERKSWFANLLIMNFNLKVEKPGTSNFVVHTIDSYKENDLIINEGLQSLKAEYFDGKEYGPFDISKYITHLKGKLGKNLIYFNSIKSTQTLLIENNENLFNIVDNVIFLSNFQTKGKGRTSNTWSSIANCLQFTLGLSSVKKLKISFVQYLVAIVICKTLRELTICDDIYIKWPNDIYAKDTRELSPRKIGGILVNCESLVEQRVYIGAGLNFKSSKEFFGIDEFLRQRNVNDLVSCELFLGVFMEELEKRMSLLEKGIFPFNEYCSLWMHR